MRRTVELLVLSDADATALDYLRRHAPCQRADVPPGVCSGVQLDSFERRGLLGEQPSLVATMREVARRGVVPAGMVKQLTLTQRGENALRLYFQRRARTRSTD